MINTNERKVQKAEIFAKWYMNTMKKALLVDSVESLENGDTIQFDYDENGNRIKEHSNDVSVTYEYDENNRLISENKDGVIVSFQYEKERSKDCTSILYENSSYTLVYDESGSVIGMKNEENDLMQNIPIIPIILVMCMEKIKMVNGLIRQKIKHLLEIEILSV